jgi:formylglycine-generating enzyme required for sulfatase activity
MNYLLSIFILSIISLNMNFMPVHKVLFVEENETLIPMDSSLVFVKGGTFKMGSKTGEEDELPVHKVKLSDFYIGKYEVTNGEFVVFLNEKGNQYEDHALWIKPEGKWRNLKCRIYEKDSAFFVEKGYEQYPVNFVNWYGANEYCKWKGGRLPTEAEWEYAAIGGKDAKRGIPLPVEEKAWYSVNSNNKIHKVGTKKPNVLGIYDMQGSLWEWCADWYDAKYYELSDRKNPLNKMKSDYRVIRGGSWANDEKMLCITNRNAIKPKINKINLGFRVVYDL